MESDFDETKQVIAMYPALWQNSKKNVHVCFFDITSSKG